MSDEEPPPAPKKNKAGGQLGFQVVPKAAAVSDNDRYLHRSLLIKGTEMNLRGGEGVKRFLFIVSGVKLGPPPKLAVMYTREYVGEGDRMVDELDPDSKPEIWDLSRKCILKYVPLCNNIFY
jgi:hypothetical protein